MTSNDRQSTHAPSNPLRHKLVELTRQYAELERISNTLTSEKETLTKKLADCSRLLKASTTGLILLNKSGLIDGVNPRALDMLAADQSYLLKKPFSLFIAPEDQAVFYILRSRIFAGTQKQPFEINLKKKDGTNWSARIHAQPFETPNQHLPGMLLAIEDISPYRQALEALQLKEYMIDLLFSIIDDLSAWSTADIDEVIVYALEKVGLVSGAHRVYVCLFHDRNTRLSITHEWLSDGIETPAQGLQGAPVKAFSRVLGQIKKRKTVAVVDIDTLPAIERSAHERFHAAGIKSFLFAPLFFGRYLMGVIGCDVVKQPVEWSRETQRLVKCVGGAIVNALLRRQAEKAPAKIRETILQFVEPTPQTDSGSPEYEGPIEIIDTDPGGAATEETHWRIEEGPSEDPDLVSTVLLRDGKTASIACKHCYRQKLLDISEIQTIGTRIKATCTCGKEMYIKVELRRELRKSVSLDGMLIRGREDRIAMKSDDWGRIQIVNLSRNGIGFKVFGKPAVHLNDRFRVKFTLDNTANSVIQKQVVVRSVADGTIGCQFVGHAPSDVTIGFYMMT